MKRPDYDYPDIRPSTPPPYRPWHRPRPVLWFLSGVVTCLAVLAIVGVLP
jgi:hypothetical protein